MRHGYEHQFLMCCLLLSFLRLCGIARLAIDRHIVALFESPLLASTSRLSSDWMPCDVAVGYEAIQLHVTLVGPGSHTSSMGLVVLVVVASNDHVVDLDRWSVTEYSANIDNRSVRNATLNARYKVEHVTNRAAHGGHVKRVHCARRV
jgi:hypothetical protein